MAALRPEHAHATDRHATATFTPRPAHTTIRWSTETDVLSSENDPSTASLQQRCHSTSASARSPSWPSIPILCTTTILFGQATVWPDRIQNRIFLLLGGVSCGAGSAGRSSAGAGTRPDAGRVTQGSGPAPALARRRTAATEPFFEGAGRLSKPFGDLSKDKE